MEGYSIKNPAATREQRRRRDVASAETRAEIVRAAQLLFLRDGYARTSIGAVAEEAGVVVQTIYNSVGKKAALLSAVIDEMAAGPRSPMAVPEFMSEAASRAPDAPAVVTLLTDWLTEVNERMAVLWVVIDEAAPGDRDVAELKRQREQNRLRNYELAAVELRRRSALAAGVKVPEAAAAIWSLGHPSVYRALVGDAGWTPTRYRSWLEVALTRALLAQC